MEKAVAMSQRFKRFSLLLLLVFMFAGCVSTSILTDWRDPGFKGTFKKVLVICNLHDSLARTTLEDDLAAQFTNRGIEAVQSNVLFASLRDVDREMVRRKVREIDADGVLLIQPYDSKINIYESYPGWDAYFGLPDQPLTAETYRVHISLFEAANGKVVWQAISETMIGGGWMDTLKKFAKAMGTKLIEHRLI